MSIYLRQKKKSFTYEKEVFDEDRDKITHKGTT